MADENMYDDLPALDAIAQTLAAGALGGMISRGF